MAKRPNILLILNDDMGFSDIGCYGGEVQTPNLDSLAANGLRFTQFYSTARCCPSRASLLTGLYPQQADIGHMMNDDGIDGYRGNLSLNAVTIAEALKQGGYKTYMSGKWHVTNLIEESSYNWPCQRGFDDYYGIVSGATNYYHPVYLVRNNERISPEKGYYITDAITYEAVRQIKEHTVKDNDKPFFQYVAYTAPHWPLHALPEDVAKYKGRFDEGWDVLREKRMQRLIDMGIIQKDWKLTDRDHNAPEWELAEDKQWQLRRMEVYAAQIDRMDQGIGKIIEALRESGQLDNTLIFFLADNGGCAEQLRIGNNRGKNEVTHTWDDVPIRFGNDASLMPGGEETYQSYGVAWANLSNTPFRLYKHWIHEGGISTPFIVHWPDGIVDRGALRYQPAQLPDIMATCLDIAGVEYPKTYKDRDIKPLEGYSILPIFENKPNQRKVLYWEHEGNKAVRKGDWKLVCQYPGEWELYDIKKDRTETNNLAAKHPDVVDELSALYEIWSKHCNIMPWGELGKLRRENALNKK